MSDHKIILDGKYIRSENDFHRALSEQLEFGPYYGNNLDALWDRLSNDIERPVTIVWLNSESSHRYLGDTFKKIVTIFSRVKEQDINFKLADKFDYQLE
ncbi:Barstar [Photorhabdus australis subsp. thailandensis]|uniref:Barstar n=1 Tax=Photorhabdus australis subsp. thailandensis TaxID=2805096 RepID=A0A1C0TZT5_9GAMM|nr:barstar family protein [Photorhabdus australis]OCQ51192.1 Barstar [Photorhabdus australis subsp. thailandensis]PQQ22829.1 barnase inhibitor [Photorhabdus luminescens]